MSALSPAAQPAAAPLDKAQPVEIWIRPKGTRRQAYYRQGSACAWREMSVPLADKALRAGKLTSGPMAGAAVVSRETSDAATHHMEAEFAAQAQSLNRAIDSMNAAARSAS